MAGGSFPSVCVLLRLPFHVVPALAASGVITTCCCLQEAGVLGVRAARRAPWHSCANVAAQEWELGTAGA